MARPSTTFSRALSCWYCQHFFIGLCPPIGTGCTWETMHGDIPATCGAPSISSLNVLIQLCRRHARLYLKKTMLARLPHCLMVGHQSPVQNRLVHRGTNFRGWIDRPLLSVAMLAHVVAVVFWWSMFNLPRCVFFFECNCLLRFMQVGIADVMAVNRCFFHQMYQGTVGLHGDILTLMKRGSHAEPQSTRGPKTKLKTWKWLEER